MSKSNNNTNNNYTKVSAKNSEDFHLVYSSSDDDFNQTNHTESEESTLNLSFSAADSSDDTSDQNNIYHFNELVIAKNVNAYELKEKVKNGEINDQAEFKKSLQGLIEFHMELSELPLPQVVDEQESNFIQKQREKDEGFISDLFYDLLYYAIINEDRETTDSLLDVFYADNNINTTDSQGRALLNQLVSEGNITAINFLLSYNPESVNESDEYHLPLYHAAITNNEEVIDLLHGVYHADIDRHNLQGYTALSHAVRHGNMGIIQLLIKCGADVNSPDDNGRTPLSYAVAVGDTEIAKFLIDNGAEVNLPDNNGVTPLKYTYHRGMSAFDTWQLLRKHGAKLDLNEVLKDKLLTADVDLPNQNDSQVILVIGNTKVGKSTLINYLSGVPLLAKSVRGQTKIDVFNESEAHLPIGLNNMQPGTSQTIKWQDTVSGITYLDCPGYNDLRDMHHAPQVQEEQREREVQYELQNAMYFKQLRESGAKHIKPLLVVSLVDILNNNGGQNFLQTVHRFIQLFEKSDLNSVYNATQLIINTSSYPLNHEIITTIRESIRELITLEDNLTNNFLQFLCREDSKIIFFNLPSHQGPIDEELLLTLIGDQEYNSRQSVINILKDQENDIPADSFVNISLSIEAKAGLAHKANEMKNIISVEINELAKYITDEYLNKLITLSGQYGYSFVDMLGSLIQTLEEAIRDIDNTRNDEFILTIEKFLFTLFENMPWLADDKLPNILFKIEDAIKTIDSIQKLNIEVTHDKYFGNLTHLITEIRNFISYPADEISERTLKITGKIVEARQINEIVNKYNREDYDQIDVFSTNAVLFNEDCCYQGKNFNIIAPHWYATHNDTTIDLKGLDGENHPPKTINDGTDGGPGHPGKPGGNFTGIGLTGSNLENLTVDVSGGNGGDGQKGAVGTTGQNGQYPTIVRGTRTGGNAERYAIEMENANGETVYCIYRKGVHEYLTEDEFVATDDTRITVDNAEMVASYRGNDSDNSRSDRKYQKLFMKYRKELSLLGTENEDVGVTKLTQVLKTIFLFNGQFIEFYDTTDFTIPADSGGNGGNGGVGGYGGNPGVAVFTMLQSDTGSIRVIQENGTEGVGGAGGAGGTGGIWTTFKGKRLFEPVAPVLQPHIKHAYEQQLEKNLEANNTDEVNDDEFNIDEFTFGEVDFDVDDSASSINVGNILGGIGVKALQVGAETTVIALEAGAIQAGGRVITNTIAKAIVEGLLKAGIKVSVAAVKVVCLALLPITLTAQGIGSAISSKLNTKWVDGDGELHYTPCFEEERYNADQGESGESSVSGINSREAASYSAISDSELIKNSFTSYIAEAGSNIFCDQIVELLGNPENSNE